MSRRAVIPAGPSAAAAPILDGYAAWVAEHDTLSDDDRAAIRADMAKMGYRPAISLLLPLGFGEPAGGSDTLAAVQAQLYPNWELLIAGQSAPHEAVVTVAARADPRIRRVAMWPHEDAADAVNAALEAATGDFAAVLLPGDRLAEHALYEVVVALAARPDAELLYTDEDRIDAAGARTAPRFKTGWDPDLLLAQDCIGALAVWRLGVLRAAGGWRHGFGRAAAYDLALRIGATLLPDRVQHLPAVLCHRPGGADGSIRDRMVGEDAMAAERAVRERLPPTVAIAPAPLWPAGRRIRWPLPDRLPLVSVIVPTRDRAELLRACVSGVLRRTDYPALEVLIVDNDSREAQTEVTLGALAADARVRILRHPGPFNFPAINNGAVAQARGEVVVLLNNDVEVAGPDWLRELVAHALRPDVGAVGAKLLYGDGTVQHAGIVFGPGLAATCQMRRAQRADPGYEGQGALTRTVLAVTGACLAMRKSVYLEVDGMNASHFAIAFNDLDLCLRLGELGYRIVWTPFAELFHLESQTRGVPDTPEKQAQEQREVEHLWYGWHHVFAADPYHNANLSCDWWTPLHLCPPRRRRPWQAPP